MLYVSRLSVYLSRKSRMGPTVSVMLGDLAQLPGLLFGFGLELFDQFIQAARRRCGLL